MRDTKWSLETNGHHQGQPRELQQAANILELKRREGTGRVPRAQMSPTGGGQRKVLSAVNGASRCNADGSTRCHRK